MQDIDIRGQCCSPPLIQVSRVLRRAGVGDYIRVLTDQRSVTRDLEAFAHVTGNRVVEIGESEVPAGWWVVLEKAPGNRLSADHRGAGRS